MRVIPEFAARDGAPAPGLARQRGVALFISLVLLLVLTIIGVSAVQTTSLETRMARNEHDTLLAFQAAESALRDAEAFLNGVNNTDGFTAAGAGGLWDAANVGQLERWEQAGVWTGGGSVEAPTAVDGEVAQRPRYLIEHLITVSRGENPYQIETDYPAPSDRIAMFRITALGIGGSANAQVLLQTTFGRIID